MRKLFVWIGMLIPVFLPAAPFHGDTMSFKQPDGAHVDVRLFGTEIYMRAEGLDGYTVVRDSQTGYICYAKLTDDMSALESTGIIYRGQKNNLKSLRTDLVFPRHIDIHEKGRQKILSTKQDQLGNFSPRKYDEFSKIMPNPVGGNIKGLCIVVDFSDEPRSLTINEFESFCNDLDYSNFGNNGSLRTYYRDVSGGLIDYENEVFGWFRAPKTFAQYEQMPYGQGAQEILDLVLNWVDEQGFDFSTLSLNSDNTIKAINLMYTGIAQNWAEGMWWHQGYYIGFSADGVYSGAYNCSPAYSPLSIGTVCHENGHMLCAWPDTYKYTEDNGPDGIGAFDIMCAIGNPFNPVPPNPHFWSNAGWGKVTDVSYINGIIVDTANSLTCRKYTNPGDTNEFYLMENRLKTGRSTALPDEGLTIWHIDRDGNNQTLHHEAYLVHANNNTLIHNNACFHAGPHDEFGMNTVPVSSWYNGDPSGLRVWDIGNVGEELTYRLGNENPSPVFIAQFSDITEIGDGDGFLEAGESGTLSIILSNRGQLTSLQPVVTCSVMADDAIHVTIPDPEIILDSLDVSQAESLTWEFTLSDNIPLGTMVNFRFAVNDNLASTFISREFLIGEQILIDNLEVSVCRSMFFDDGGPDNSYADNEDYIITFLSPEENQVVKIEFLTFGMESDLNCIYDYLKIYNGPDVRSPLLGTWCGSDNPGTLISTHPGGGLTLRFHSDMYVNGIGWSAKISCVVPDNLEGIAEKPIIEVAPNPVTNTSILKINYPSSGQLQVIITDVSGVPVQNFLVPSRSEVEINRHGWSSGMYLLQVWEGPKLIYTSKLMMY